MTIGAWDHVWFGVVVGGLAGSLGYLFRSFAASASKSVAIALVRATIVLLAVDLLVASLVLLLGADGTQDGLFAGDVRVRNAVGATVCLVVGAAGWAFSLAGRPR